MEEKKKYKNLATYAVTFVLAVIVLIIFAAMADSREQKFEMQLDEKESVNASIQNEIVTLKDQNYNLTNKLAETEKMLTESKAAAEFYSKLTDAYVMYTQDKKAEAEEVISSIAADKLTEEQLEKYNTISELISTLGE